MKPIALILACALLAGCDTSKRWDSAPETHACTPEQHDEAMRRALDREKHDDSETYFRYFYGQAVLSICEPKP